MFHDISSQLASKPPALLGFGDDVAEVPILQFLQGTNLRQKSLERFVKEKNMTISEFIRDFMVIS
jgi:hypothetical protein